MPAAQLEQALDELLRAELVFRRGTPADAGYAFKHALIRDTAYNSMVRSQRALRHAQIAQALERSEPQTVAIHPELLAQHHQEAGHVQRSHPLLDSGRRPGAATIRQPRGQHPLQGRRRARSRACPPTRRAASSSWLCT